MMQGQVTMAPDKFFESSMKALQPVVSRAVGGTVDVMVDGTWRLRNGKFVTCDEVAIRSSAQVEAAALYERRA